MSTTQLDTAIVTLESEHGTFLTKATAVHDASTVKRTTATNAKDDAQVAQAGAEGAETATIGHRDGAGTAKTTAQSHRQATSAANQAAIIAKDAAVGATGRARRAAMRAEAIQAGDVSAYTQWLLDSPVGQGTLGMSFGDLRDPSQEALVMDFENSDYQVFEATPDHFVYE